MCRGVCVCVCDEVNSKRKSERRRSRWARGSGGFVENSDKLEGRNKRCQTTGIRRGKGYINNK